MLSDYYIIRYYIIIDCSILFFINDYFFEKPKIALKACFLHNRSFINSLVFVRLVFINWEQNYVPAGTFTNNDSTYLDVLMQNIWFNKNHRNHRKIKKTSFPKEILENADLHKAALTKIMTTQEKDIKYDLVAPLMWNNAYVKRYKKWNIEVIDNITISFDGWWDINTILKFLKRENFGFIFFV